MKTFFLCMFGSAVVVYAAVMLPYMIAGDAAWLIAGLLALGAVFGLLACALEKLDLTEQRLDRLEQKLDRLLAEREKDEKEDTL